MAGGVAGTPDFPKPPTVPPRQQSTWKQCLSFEIHAGNTEHALGPDLYVRKARSREIKWFAQSHPADLTDRGWQSRNGTRAVVVTS